MARDVQEARVRLDRAESRQRERGHRPKVDRDWEAVKRLLAEQDELTEATSRLRAKYGDSEEVASVEDLARRRISDAEPIRISHAQKLLVTRPSEPGQTTESSMTAVVPRNGLVSRA